MSQPSNSHSSKSFDTPWLYSFWKFSRPHTIIGTSLSVFGLCAIAIALTPSAVSPPILPLITAWIACLCGNIYIVGLNQLEDVAIDKINKPHLPIAAGEFSQEQGQIIVKITGILALLLAVLGGPWLLATVSISLLLGTAYSLQPIRLKRFPFWAAFCIYTVRGIIVNLGLFLHSVWLLTNGSDRFNFERHFYQLSLPPEIWGLTLFILAYTLAIAIFKDIPDIKGDREYHITTFTIHFGAKAVFNLARWILTGCYLGMVILGWWLLPGVNPIFVAIAHITALIILWWRSLSVDLENQAAIAAYYQFIWKFFFLEYLLFPVACFLA
jgi:homogentisate phytyltransferase/homogentisate geranylgeranyltransferase